MKELHGLALLLALLSSAGAGCRGLGKADLDGLERIGEALGSVTWDTAPSLLLTGLGELDLGNSADCRKGLMAIERVEPAHRPMLAAETARACKLGCAGDLGALAGVAPGERAARIVAACDRVRPEVVFTGEMQALRPEMEPLQYLVLREILGKVRLALLEDGSPRARKIWKSYQAVLPRVAAALVVRGREGLPPEARTPQAAPDAPPAEEKAAAPRHLPVIAVSGGAILLDGARVAAAADTAGDDAGETIAALAAQLAAWKKRFEAGHPGQEVPARAILRADGDVDLRIIKKIAVTAAAAGHAGLDFAVPLRDRSFTAVRWSGSLGAPLVLAVGPASSVPEWGEGKPGTDGAKEDRPESIPEWLKKGAADHAGMLELLRKGGLDDGDGALTVLLEQAGCTLVGAGGDRVAVPRAGERDDEAALAKALDLAREATRTARLLVGGDAGPWTRALRVLHVAASHGYTTLGIALTAPLDAGAAPANAGILRVDARPAATAGTAQVLGNLDKELIRRIIQRHINEVKFCYERELARSPSLQGRVMVQFTIAATGSVVASVVQSSTLGNPIVEQCITTAVRRWEFPKPTGGGVVIVSYPFVLKSS